MCPCRDFCEPDSEPARAPAPRDVLAIPAVSPSSGPHDGATMPTFSNSSKVPEERTVGNHNSSPLERSSRSLELPSRLAPRHRLSLARWRRFCPPGLSPLHALPARIGNPRAGAGTCGPRRLPRLTKPQPLQIAVSSSKTPCSGEQPSLPRKPDRDESSRPECFRCDARRPTPAVLWLATHNACPKQFGVSLMEPVRFPLRSTREEAPGPCLLGSDHLGRQLTIEPPHARLGQSTLAELTLASHQC